MVYTVVNKGGNKEDEDENPKSNQKSGIGFWDLDLELQAIKTMLTPSSEWATKVYSVCKEEFFHHSTTKAIFSRLHSMMEGSKSYELPTLDFVLSDSKIPPALRQTLRDALDEDGDPVGLVSSQGDYDLLVQGLMSLAKTRALYQATHRAANDLLDSSEPTELIKQVTDQLGESLFRMEDDDELLAQITMGKGYSQSAEDAFCRIVNGSFEETKIKSGFKEFDERTGGFHRTNLVIAAAGSGHGKCTIFQTLIPTDQGILQIGDIYNLYANPDDAGWINIPEGSLKVYTREGIKDVNGVFKSEGSTYEVKTNWGDEFEGLGEHKLYCYDSQTQTFGFKRLDEIQTERDWVLKTVGTQLFGNRIDITFTDGNRRTLPQFIMQASEDIQCVFLRELYEEGGSIQEDGNIWALQYTSTSKQIIYKIKALLENIGIYCAIYYDDKIYHLNIMRESYALFQQKIGFISETKNKELAKCIEYKNKRIDSANHVCIGFYTQIPKQPSIACSNAWAQVSSVEKKEEVVPVFDLSVPGQNEYAANGLMSHNSLLAVNMLERQYRLGYNVVLASYEMTDEEVLVRLLANIGEVDMNRLQNNKLNPAETQQVTAAWREFNLKGYEKGNSYHILAPKTETTVPEIGFRVRSMKPDILILDYINLLGSSSGTQEAQWQSLGNIAREAKLLANKLNCVVILLAQIDETYTLRYSKGIKDHANFVWGFIRDDTAISSRIINIHQMKARNAPLYNFDLIERFNLAQFRDMDQTDRASWPTQDELLMLELQCQSLGLKLEPTASKEFDKKKRLEQKQLVINNVETKQLEQAKVDEKIGTMERPATASLLFSADDSIPIDFSKLTVKSSSVSLLKSDNLYEDTV